MGSSGGSASNPAQTAAVQQMYNDKSAKKTQQMNMIDQTNQYGSLKYVQTGKYADGTPKYEAQVALSPEQQNLYNTQTGTQQTAATGGQDLLTNWLQQYGQGGGINTSDTSNYLYDLGNQRLDPQLAQQRASTETALLNRGIVPGTEAYDRAMALVGQQENDARNQLYLTGQQQAYNQLRGNMQDQLSSAASLYGLGTGTAPQAGFVSTPTSNVQPADYTSAVNAANAAKAQANAGMLGGIGSIAGSLFSALKFSDKRLKENIERVGKLDNGLPVYAYNYKAGGPRHIGVMAQDVLKENPEAVEKIGGFWAVDYGKAVE